MPTVSIIVPNYNHAPYLEQRIGSILGQTCQDFELILLDDHSTDGSQALLRQYASHPKVAHLVANTINSGSPFAQWTKGFALARGEWVWVAESDDWAEPTFLQEMLAAATPTTTLLTCDSLWTDPEGRTLWQPQASGIERHNGLDYIRHHLSTHNDIPNVSSCLIRRQGLKSEQYPLYNRMRLCGDWMLYLLLAEQGDVVELHRPLNHYRQHPSNTSSTAERQGLTFLEGADILDRLRTQHHLPARAYARPWGRLWARYDRQYHIPTATRRAIRRRLWPHYPSIVIYHHLYRIKQWLA